MTAYNPDPARPRGATDCLLADLLDPATRDAWDWQSDHADLCNRCQEHGYVLGGRRQCLPSQCFKHNSCRFHFPFPPTATSAAVIERSAGLDRKRFAPVRNDPWLNQHSKPVLLAWRANMDLQPVLDQNAAIKYVSKYATVCCLLVMFATPVPVLMGVYDSPAPSPWASAAKAREGTQP